MEFNVTVLGSNSALPTNLRSTTSQVVQHNTELFLIDCGEGTQLQLRRFNISFVKINHIFISHLHGDHFYGLFGLLTSFSLMGRKQDLHIYSHSYLKEMLEVVFKYAGELNYKIVYHDISNLKPRLIANLKYIEVYSFPLKHRVPTCGFLFKEKPLPSNIRPDMIRLYELKHEEVRHIKAGNDYVDSDGKVVKNERFMFPSKPQRSYAFCSDTMYSERIVETIKGVNLLYHEATFMEKDAERAKKTMHSTAKQAAQIAKLAQANKLLIGHFSSRYTNIKDLESEAKSIFENTKAVNDGEIYRID